MFGQPGSDNRGGCSNYSLRIVFVLLAIIMMIVYYLLFIRNTRSLPAESTALFVVAWFFQQEVLMPNIGPVTMEKIKAIIERIDSVSSMEAIEELGRRMGIPEEKQYLACRIVEIELQQRIKDEIAEMRADNERLHQERAKKQKDGFHILTKIVSSINGILKSEE